MKSVKEEDFKHVVGGTLERPYVPFPDIPPGGSIPGIPVPPLPSDPPPPPTQPSPVGNPGIRWPPRLPPSPEPA